MTQLFYTYDTADTRQRDRMEKLLQSLKERGVIAGWGSHSVGRGTKWRGEVSSQIKSADLTLLLLSNDFLSSGYLRTSEMSLALERHQQGETRIVPVLLRPCDLKGTPLAMLPALPRGKPVSRWNNADEAFDAIATGIVGLVALRNGTAAAASAAAADAAPSETVDATANVPGAAESAAAATPSASPTAAAAASATAPSSASETAAAAPATAAVSTQDGAPAAPNQSLEDDLPPIRIALAPKEIGAEYEALEMPKDRQAATNGKARPWYTSVARANKRRVAQTVYRLDSPSDASKRLEAAIRAEVSKGGHVETLADITDGVARRVRTEGQPASSVSVIAAKGRFLVGAKVMEAGDGEEKSGQDPVALADSVVRRMLARIPA